MKFKYWHFVTLYFIILLIMEGVQAYVTKTLSVEEAHHDLMTIIVYCGLIDFMNDRMGV